MKLELLPDSTIQKILEFFQTKKMIKNEDQNEYQINQLITKQRKLINIKTDIKTILNFSMANRHFNELIKGPVGKLILTVHYNSKDIINDNLQHISYCSEINCRNICHYVNKDINHKNIIKKLAVERFGQLKNNKQFKEDIIHKFKIHLTDKQIESYYKIKKMDKKLKEHNEKTKACKFSKLDSFSFDSDIE